MPEQFDCDLLFNLAIIAFREKNLTHSASPQQTLQAVGSAAKTRRRGLFERFQYGSRRPGHCVCQGSIGHIESEQGLQLSAHIVRNLVLLEVALASGGLEVRHLAEKPENFVPHNPKMMPLAAGGKSEPLEWGQHP